MTALRMTRRMPNDAHAVAEKLADLPQRLPAGLLFEALDDRNRRYQRLGQNLHGQGAGRAIADRWRPRGRRPACRCADRGRDGGALGRLIASQALACVVDVSELGSGVARRRFMAAFAEAIYDANAEPLHLVLDEADLWAPQRPLPDQMGLLGRIEEIVRRGQVRGFIPWHGVAQLHSCSPYSLVTITDTF
jgi:hypothetical protein